MRGSAEVVVALGRAGMVSSRLKQAIQRHPAYAYAYAAAVLRCRWPEGEAALLTNSMWANFYARNIIRGPWPEAEAVIATDHKEWQRYLRHTQGADSISFTLTVRGGAVVPPT